jgi:cyclopropane-fatty-acyl-phospholipid synthase
MATKEDIQFHYDVDNEFYKLFLDKNRMAYSCGVWKTAASLEEAQEHKLERLCKYAHVEKNDVVLDVGCGWGGLMDKVIEQEALSAHGLTLSQDQFDYIQQKKHSSISVDLCAWQQYSSQVKHDAIISIGAFEHFASVQDRKAGQQRRIYRHFFEWCHDISTDDAYIGLQTIITARLPDNIQEVRDVRYLLDKVFPGSALPTISDIQVSASDLYEISAIKRIGLDYARTLSEWHDRLVQNEREVRENFGDEIYEHYVKYFLSAKRNFESGVVDLVQLSLKKVLPTKRFA